MNAATNSQWMVSVMPLARTSSSAFVTRTVPMPRPRRPGSTIVCRKTSRDPARS